MVLTITTDFHTLDNHLLIWLMWAKERGQANGVDVWPFFEQLTRHYGCKRLETKSIQMPVVEYMKNTLGWTISEITIGTDIDEE